MSSSPKAVPASPRPRRGLHVALGVGVALLIALGTGIAAFVNAGGVRGLLERQVSARTGRTLTIGSLDAHLLTFTPHLHARDVRFANAAWSKPEDMFAAREVELSLSLRNLFHREVVLPLLRLEQANIVLERDAAGRANWQFDDKPRPKSETPLFPQVDTLLINDGKLHYTDRMQDTALRVVFSQDAQGERLPLSATAEGKLLGRQLKATAHGERLTELADAGTPYAVTVQAALGATRASFDGSINPRDLVKTLNGKVTLAGPDLSVLGELLTVVLPHTPPYKLAGSLSHERSTWSLKDFEGHVGGSDLRGDFSVDQGRDKPFILARLQSKLLDVVDLGGFIGATPSSAQPRKTEPVETGGKTQTVAKPERDARPTKPAKTTSKAAPATDAAQSSDTKAPEAERVMPANRFPLAALRAMGADVTLTAKRVVPRAGLPLDDFHAHLLLQEGVLTLKPLNFGVSGGHITSDVRIQIEPSTMLADIDARFRNLGLDGLLPKLAKTIKNAGRIDGRAKLAGRGSSFAEVLSRANGDIGLVMVGGEMSNLLLEITGLDGAEAVKFLLGGDRAVPVRCAAASFTSKEGLLTSEVLVLDTEDTNITGRAEISMPKETLAIDLYPLPKDMSFAVLRGPIHITGPFSKPSVSLDRGAVAARLGAAALLSLVNPFASLLAFIETGPGQDSPCAELVAQARAPHATPQPGKTAKSAK